MQRSERHNHPARDVSDAQLVPLITFPVKLDQARAVELLTFLVKTAGKWDNSAYAIPAETLIAQLNEAQHSTYDLGGGGAVMFYPIAQGDQATAHFYIWDPVWMNRTEILRSVITDAVKRWNLRKLLEMVPAANTLGCRNAEKIGFTLEGVLRENVVYTVGETPQIGDVHLYGLLRREVEAWQ